MSAETAETPATAAAEVAAPPGAGNQGPTTGQRLLRELRSWCWVALAFLLITGTMVQARVIPSGSMEKTLLVGDHLLMSRLGYDASVPFTHYHLRLWREPHRQQMIIFRAPIPGPDRGFHQAADRPARRPPGNPPGSRLYQRHGAGRALSQRSAQPDR